MQNYNHIRKLKLHSTFSPIFGSEIGPMPLQHFSVLFLPEPQASCIILIGSRNMNTENYNPKRDDSELLE